jgi:hypothetical protein
MNIHYVGVVYNLGSYTHISHVAVAKNDKFGSLSSRSCFKAKMTLSYYLMVNETFQFNHLTVHCDSFRAWVSCNAHAIFLGINIRIRPHFNSYVLEFENTIHLTHMSMVWHLILTYPSDFNASCLRLVPQGSIPGTDLYIDQGPCIVLFSDKQFSFSASRLEEYPYRFLPAKLHSKRKLQQQ